MSNPRINFIGCGRLGKTLASLFKIKKVANINGVVCSSISNSISSIKVIGEGIPCKTISELPNADIHFITTKDDMISEMCDELVRKNLSNSIIVHCSGSLSSEVLTKAKIAGHSVASIHPIKSFADIEESIRSFPGTYCAIEGDEIAVPVIKELFTNIGANIFQINKNKKSLYHAAGVIANNYMVTLHHTATQCYESADIDKKTASVLVSKLASEALNNITSMSHEKALTGPLQRGDTKTIRNHTIALSGLPIIQNMYKALGLATLPLTAHSTAMKDEITEILTNPIKPKL